MLALNIVTARPQLFFPSFTTGQPCEDTPN